MNRQVAVNLLIAMLFLRSCGGAATGANFEPTVAMATSTSLRIATATPSRVDTTQPASTSNTWKAIRDERFGFGFALP